MDPMDTLWEMAEIMARQETPRPDFFVAPSLYKSIQEEGWMQVKETTTKGYGWFARRDIPAGTRVLVSKPLAMIMNWEVEDDEEEYEEEEEEEEDGDEDDDDEWEDIDEDEEEEDCGMDTEATTTTTTTAPTKLEHGKSNENNENNNNNDNDDDDDSEMVSPTTGRLLLRLISRLCQDPSLWERELCHLFPRDEETARRLGLCQSCRNAGIQQELEEAWKRLKDCTTSTTTSNFPFSQVRLRLGLVVRYNALSVETCPELFCHPSTHVGYATLSGTALYGTQASLFNHEAWLSFPNVARWAVGDVMVFVTNQFVAAESELCISYLEHAVLCETAAKRTQLLNMDFVEKDDDEEKDDDDKVGGNSASKRRNDKDNDDDDDDKDNGPDAPVVDAQVQQELMDMPPLERLEAIRELLIQARGGGSGEYHKNDDNDDDNDDDDDDDMKDPSGKQPSTTTRWFHCDAQELGILQALTLDALGRHEAALEVWRACIAFCTRRLPPLDESGIVLGVQAALCAWACRRQEEARTWAAQALEQHHLLFGGGVQRFHRRFAREMELTLRPEESSVRGAAALEALFPLE